MATVTKQQIGVEDIDFDAGGAGAVNTFSRTKPDGTSGTYTQVSAAHVPVLDVPVVASARTPFAGITTATDRDVEECLRRLRINAREAKNIEHYGAVAGSGITTAQAERNVLAWRQCLDDINSEGRNNGIFLPGARYEGLSIPGGTGLYASNIFPFETSSAVRVSNVAVFGSPGSQLAAHSTANVNHPLLFGSGVSGITVLDVALEHRAAAAAPLVFLDPLTAGIMSSIRFDKVSFLNGASLIRTNWTSGANYVKDLWVTNCVFGNAVSYGLDMDDVAGAKVDGNIFSGVNAGVRVSASGAPNWGNYEFVNNRLLSGSVKDFLISSGGATFNGTIHNSITLRDNRLSFGSIQVTDVNDLTVENNRLFEGIIIGTFSANPVSVYDIRIHRNTVTMSSALSLFSAITIANASTNMRRWWITENDIYLARRHGIHINPSGSGRLRGGDISRNMILDPSQAGAAVYDGIMLDSVGATDGTSETIVSFNRITSTNAGLKMARGITERSGAVNGFNRFIYNAVKGWTTSAVQTTSADSSQAATVGGTSTTIDYLTGV